MNNKDRKLIFDAYLKKEVMVQSVTKNKVIEWKPVTDVMKHNVKNKTQYKINLDNGVSCTVTEDHSLFLDDGHTIKSVETKRFQTGDNIVFIDNEKVLSKKVSSNLVVPSIEFMFDLSVQDNENFVLKSGLLAHNSFRPPASEKFIQGQTQVFGFIWEDEEMMEYIYMAIDDFNSRPPVTGLQIQDLWGNERRWRTTIIMRSAAFACFAIAMNWVADEFSICGKERLTVKDEENNEYSLSAQEFFNIIYGDKIKEIEDAIKIDCAEAIKEIEDEEKRNQ